MTENYDGSPIFRSAPGSVLSSSVAVPAGYATVYLSGMAAWKSGGNLDDNYGDTEAQTANIIEKIRAELDKLGLSLSDIVMLRVTLAADPKLGNKIDFAGYTRAYQRFFGTLEQPRKPARATYEGKLVIPHLLVEIEAIAATRAAQDQCVGQGTSENYGAIR